MTLGYWWFNFDDHLWPVKLQSTHITGQQVFNSGVWWSIYSGERWSELLTEIINFIGSITYPDFPLYIKSKTQRNYRIFKNWKVIKSLFICGKPFLKRLIIESYLKRQYNNHVGLKNLRDKPHIDVFQV